MQHYLETEEKYDIYIPPTIGNLVYISTITKWVLYKEEIPEGVEVTQEYVRDFGRINVTHNYVNKDRILQVNRIYTDRNATIGTTYIYVSKKYPEDLNTTFIVPSTDEEFRQFIKAIEKVN